MDKETSIPYTGYKISRDKVIYTTVYNELRYKLPVENADPATFEILSSMYGKDKHYVFWMSQVIERADPETFEVLQGDYAKDKDQVYAGSDIISKSPKDFEFLSHEFVRCAEGILFKRIPIRYTGITVDVGSFEPLNQYYSRDKNKVYCTYYGYDCYNTEVVDTDRDNFRVISGPFAKDIKHIFLYGEMAPQFDPDSFQVINEHFVKDHRHVYFLKSSHIKHTEEVFPVIVEGADPVTFEIMTAGPARWSHPVCGYARDKKYVYRYVVDWFTAPDGFFHIETLPGADPITFDDEQPIDSHEIFNRVMNESDPGTAQNDLN